MATGAVFTAAYLGVAVLVGVDFPELRDTARLESFATQLLMPSIATIALAYAAALLRERERSARLAVEAERRRIGIELGEIADVLSVSADDSGERVRTILGKLRVAVGPNQRWQDPPGAVSLDR